MEGSVNRLSMYCEEQARLVGEHHKAAIVYSRVLKALNNGGTKLPASGYRQLRREADDARVKCEAARLALARHKAEHGC
jgi:hypothetical protein